MEYQLIPADQFETKPWAGGTTRELFIFPPESNYQQRNFQFRLSTASVEIEESDFTSLPGVTRKLMVLEGEIILHHQNHYTRTLEKFEVETFQGDWVTHCKGTCTDFNLMTNRNTKGNVYAMHITSNQGELCSINGHPNWIFIYAYKGKISLEIDQQKLEMNTGDLLIIKQPALSVIEIKGIENSELIFIEIIE